MNNPDHDKPSGLPPGRWEGHFRKAHLLVEELDRARSAQARATILGNFLSQNQGREVPIQVGDRSGRARLCVAGGDKKPRRYYVEIAWDPDSDADSSGTPSAANPAGLDDGLGGPAAEEPEAPPAVRPPSTRDGVAAAARPGSGHTTPDRPAAGNQEDWS